MLALPMQSELLARGMRNHMPCERVVQSSPLAIAALPGPAGWWTRAPAPRRADRPLLEPRHAAACIPASPPPAAAMQCWCPVTGCDPICRLSLHRGHYSASKAQDCWLCNEGVELQAEALELQNAHGMLCCGRWRLHINIHQADCSNKYHIGCNRMVARNLDREMSQKSRTLITWPFLTPDRSTFSSSRFSLPRNLARHDMDVH